MFIFIIADDKQICPLLGRQTLFVFQICLLTNIFEKIKWNKGRLYF